MGMFKSKEEKRIERDIEVRKGVNSLKRNIRDLAKHEVSYILKAKKAKKIGDQSQYDFLKRQLKKTAAQKRMRERQLLSIETAVQRRYLGETYYFENEYNASVFDDNPYAYLYNDNVHLSARPDRTDQN